jgi:hypothetical protein
MDESMADALANALFTELLIKLMEQHKVYKVTLDTEVGDHEYNLILDEEDHINIYDSGQIGTC